MKILFWILLLALVAFLMGVKRARPRRDDAAPPPKPPAPAPRGPEAMVSCAECGTHLPASESLPGRGGQFCSAAHRAAFEARQG